MHTTRSNKRANLECATSFMTDRYVLTASKSTQYECILIWMQKVERKDGMNLAGGRFPRRVRKAFTRMNDRSGRAIEDVEAKLIQRYPDSFS